jgi:chromosome partitioning protein
MNVLVFASRKGGSGKSTLAVLLAAHVHKLGRSCLLIDDDPQGSLTLWNELREDAALPIKIVKRHISDVLRKAKRRDVDWVFIDTPPNASACVIEAIEAATLAIIPCRPGLFDIDAVQETIALARSARTPYAVVLNGAAAKRDGVESPAVSTARQCLAGLGVPVWGGQVTHRASFALSLSRGESVQGFDSDTGSGAEITRLWSAIEKSVAVIKSASDKKTASEKAAAMHRVAA